MEKIEQEEFILDGEPKTPEEVIATLEKMVKALSKLAEAEEKEKESVKK